MVEKHESVSVIRKLDSIEILFLIQFHMKLAKTAKLIEFSVNSQDLASWK